MATPSKSYDAINQTENCKTISYHFSMGIGRMRQIRDLKVETTANASELRHQKRLIDSPELDEIRSQDNKLKRFIEQQSAAAGSESTRFVLSTEIENIWKVVEAYRTIRRPQLVAAFMAQISRTRSG